jgi:hypothetical protein
MRVYCPCTAITPATRAALDASGYRWEPRDVSASDGAYWALLAELWAAGEEFAVVEHDVVPSPSALASFEACGNDWCSCPYPYLAGTYAGLGCTRFRAAIMSRHPDLMDVVATMSNDAHEPKFWCTLDGFMQIILRGRGERQCTAHPEAGHPSHSPAHGCVPGYPPRA